MHYSHLSTPKPEIEYRIKQLQSHISSVDLDGFLILSIVELYYYTGIGLDGALFVPRTGEPIHLIKRNRELAEAYSGIDIIRDYGRTAGLFKTLNISGGSVIALELDILPYSYTKFLNSLNRNLSFQDGSKKLRELRSVKSQFEIKQISTAAKLVDESFEYCKNIASPDMSEISLASKLDKWLLDNGHHGYVKTRAFNSALLNLSYVISSSSAILNIHFTPISGCGLTWKYPYGPSKRKIGNKPFFVDTCGNHNGYISDTTRTFNFGKFDQITLDQINALIEIKKYLKTNLKPGANLKQIFTDSYDLAKELKIHDNFMGAQNDKAAFLGHGVGLELDELPIIYPGGGTTKAGNVIACEPKLIEKELKVLGVEDTFVITEKGNSIITKAPDFFEI